MPTISQLQYILAVDRFRHFGKAAKASYISQPSLSMQVQKVEEEVGFPIFNRNKKPILATEKGEKFIAQAKSVIREHEKLIQLSQEDFNAVSGQFRLAMIPTVMPYLLPSFIRRFSESYPDVTLHIDEMKTQDIITALRMDALDAGILATPLKEKGIRESLLYYEPFFFYGHQDHPLLANKAVYPDDINGDDIWLLEDGHCFKNQVSDFCALSERAGVYSNVVFEGGNLETLRYLVKEGRGYTLVPSLFADVLPDEEKKKMLRPFGGEIPTREISLVFSRDQWKTDIIKAIETVITEHLPQGLSRELGEKQTVLPV